MPQLRPARVLKPALGPALSALLLVACATAPPQPTPLPNTDERQDELASVDAAEESKARLETERWQDHAGRVRELTRWKARGKVAYRLPEDGGSANLIWEQSGTQSELRLSGPLGAGSTRVRNDGPLIKVRRDGIERRYPADAAPWLPGGSLMPIPIDAIHYWLRGIPDPTRPIDELGVEDGLARVIRQEGWRVAVEEYHNDAPPLPKRLRIEAVEVGLVLRTYLREWSIAED